MPQALISRTVQMSQDEWQLVEDFRVEKHLRSWSKGFLTILAQWDAYRRQGRAQIEARRQALALIAEMPWPEQDNMIAANMRRIATEALR